MKSLVLPLGVRASDCRRSKWRVLDRVHEDGLATESHD